MAEITNLKGPDRYIFSRYILYVLIFLLSGLVLSAQQPKTQPVRKKIVLQNADEDNIGKDPLTGKDIHHLKGNVRLLDNETKMSCDSAIFYTGNNQVTAFIKVHIEQGDTLNLYGDYLFYDGKLGKAFVKGNVELIDKETHLYTDSIHYDVRNRIAKYTERGRIKNADNTLTSIIGVYYAVEKLFHFKDSVKIVNPKYVMTADTMDYNSLSEIAYFTGPTHLVGDSLNMYCERGWYDTKKEITSVWKNAMIDNHHQIIHGDSLYFNNNTGFGESFRNVIIQDTVNNLAIEGNYAWVYKEPERFLVTDKAVFIQISDQDSLFLHADTINSVSKLIKIDKKITEATVVAAITTVPTKSDTIKTLTDKTDTLKTVANKMDTIKPVVHKMDTVKTITNIFDTLKAVAPIKKPATSYRLMKAFHNVRIFSKDLQAKCDSLSYSFRDSVIRLYTRPVIWSAENQLTADSMALFTKNRQSDRLELYNNAFIAMFVDTIRYNQIKGRSLTGYFKNNELFKIDIKGNGESVYYLLDGDAVAGRNQSKCANMEVRLEKGKVSEIYEYENPDGFIDPPLPANPVRLDGFKWLDLLRPKKMEDIFIKTK
jgi:lipopolysaccharide export system protein LptA